MKLNDLLALQFVLPSIPKVVALLLSELDRDEPDLKTVTQLISTDPALTTRLLQLSNSGFFKLSGKVSSVTEALAILGLGHVRTMAAAAASGASFKAVPGINLQQFWAYSLNVAKLARSLAGVVRQNQQAAFTCGLIHAVGELAMHMGMPTEVAALDLQVPPLDLQRAKVESWAFGFCYAQVGAGFARQWHFPQPIVDALEHQYAPFDNEVYEPLAGVIHLAAWRARAKEAGLSDKALAVTFPGSVGEVLGLDIDMVLQQDPIDWSSQTSGRSLL
ncbi:MAG: HDOD domain-containing protein [Rhodoferax sp.]|uniref:HDOD domain-containing protein n=1 Tax=Rhodoferax sp. TaxID=50421 RepID=UPI0017E34DEF|nr:HDOD domain-containing protein [Rhodoferax sp.]NMM15415.1 HDOD domain-containing protein [Rhodoferax sp.]NMM21117.1 HDOD domain-containing protein [Rhodoferax sp.]